MPIVDYKPKPRRKRHKQTLVNETRKAIKSLLILVLVETAKYYITFLLWQSFVNRIQGKYINFYMHHAK